MAPCLVDSPEPPQRLYLGFLASFLASFPASQWLKQPSLGSWSLEKHSHVDPTGHYGPAFKKEKKSDLDWDPATCLTRRILINITSFLHENFQKSSSVDLLVESDTFNMKSLSGAGGAGIEEPQVGVRQVIEEATMRADRDDKGLE
ncbi:hypothetical protein P7K49_006105 [Saguinus oedipus]|uniref:Uncharacterized protein n=1 Tax=Saguinus oedipus TaxID=9490 RepID=A0ABQ9W330_SAGOE|nr:hypothetical protein P7K49_006105 [Saguinus oedipus]